MSNADLQSLTPGSHLDRIAGVLLGTAVGDAIGLPRENLSPRRAARLFGGAPLRHRFLFGRGMTSDDLEHTALVAQALLRHPDDPDAFARALGWGLRGWLLGVPAGVGWATLRACLKLCVGFPPSRSGVYSAGNGPAMRSALLGVCFKDDPDNLRAFVRACSRITHTDARAERGALLVALSARHGSKVGAKVDPARFLAEARAALPDLDSELAGILDTMAELAARKAPPADLATALGQGRGVSGYVYRSVPVAVYSWLHAPGDFRQVVEGAVLLGGDADTNGAIAGAIAGATLGSSGIPAEWLGLWEWPRSVRWLRAVAGRLAEQFPEVGAGRRVGPAPLFWPGLLPRNLLFVAAVFLHVARRLLPPY